MKVGAVEHKNKEHKAQEHKFQNRYRMQDTGKDIVSTGILHLASVFLLSAICYSLSSSDEKFEQMFEKCFTTI